MLNLRNLKLNIFKNFEDWKNSNLHLEISRKIYGVYKSWNMSFSKNLS